MTQAPAVVGDEVESLAEALEPGEVLVLENSRFEPGETENDPALADGWRSSPNTSTTPSGPPTAPTPTTHGVAQHLPGHAGLLLERELQGLGKVRDPEPPLVVVLEAKVTDKIGVIEKFLDAADEILIGGAMCFQLLQGRGRDTGESLLDDSSVEAARDLLPREKAKARLHLRRPGAGPRVQRRYRGDGAERRGRPRGLDGLRHRRQPGGQVLEADFDHAAPCCGTARWALSSWGRSQRARGSSPRRWPRPPLLCSVVGGGDSAAAMVQFGLDDDVDWLSTGERLA